MIGQPYVHDALGPTANNMLLVCSTRSVPCGCTLSLTHQHVLSIHLDKTAVGELFRCVRVCLCAPADGRIDSGLHAIRLAAGRRSHASLLSHRSPACAHAHALAAAVHANNRTSRTRARLSALLYTSAAAAAASSLTTDRLCDMCVRMGVCVCARMQRSERANV